MTDRPEQRRAKSRRVSKGHNLDVIKTADWVIDLGPSGGVNGGEVVVAGTPEVVAAEVKSFTGHYLRPLLGAGFDKAVRFERGRETEAPAEGAFVHTARPESGN